MKKDLTTAIITAVICIVASYLVCNLFLPALESVSFKTLSGDTNYSLAEPDNEIFNYRAINPTVEVYVGGCTSYDENGNCLDEITSTPIEEGQEPSEEGL